jgi:ABC-type transport system substrate-binding protein
MAHSVRGSLIESRSYYPTTRDRGQAQSNLAIRCRQRRLSNRSQWSGRIAVDATAQPLYNAANSYDLQKAKQLLAEAGYPHPDPSFEDMRLKAC